MNYDREVYWSEVAGRIAERPNRREVAGDEDAFYRYKRRKMLSRFLGALPVAGRVVMELGSGPGGNLEWLLANRRPVSVVGVDISDTMLRLAKQRLGLRAMLRKTDGTTIPLADASVDVAYTVTVLQHNTQPEQLATLARELARVTRGPIVLMEDTASEPHTGDSWIVRTVDEHVNAMRAVGYRLASRTYLGLRVSRAGYGRIVAKFPRPEGAPAPWLLRTALAAWISVAAPLDRVVPDSADLTKMVFERE